MGFLRKGLFVATGGLSGAAGVKANSKKERTAKALEKQNRVAQRDGRSGGLLGTVAAQKTTKPLPAEVSTVTLVDELAKAGTLHQQGLLTDNEFAAIKARLLNEATPQVATPEAATPSQPVPGRTPRPTKDEKQAEGDRRLVTYADRGWRSGMVLTPKGKKRVAAVRQAQGEATPAEDAEDRWTATEE
jgi:hypothetical protein